MKYIYFTRDDCNPMVWRYSKKTNITELLSKVDNAWIISISYPNCFIDELGGHTFRSLKAAQIFVS